LVSASLVLSGCLGFGTGDGETPTPTPSPRPETETVTPTDPPTVEPTPTTTKTATPARRLDFDPDGPVVQVGEAISVGPREFRTTDWVLKREIRYFDGRTDTIGLTTPKGSDTQWFQVAGRVTNTGDSLVPAPSMDDFRVRHAGGRAVPTYRIDDVGRWGNLREAGLENPVSEPGLDRQTTYIPPDKTIAFHVLFVVDSGPELYLEWDAPGRREPVYVQVRTES
jgi:hypothetical protein